MEETIVTFMIAVILACLWLLRFAFEFGKAAERQDIFNRRSTAQNLPESPPIVEDKPAEQAGFVFMHENFIEDPPLETKE